MLRELKEKEPVIEDGKPEHSPSPFFILPEDSDFVFRVAINYSQLSEMQAASIQPILLRYRRDNRCYISDSEEVGDDGECIVSLAFNERNAATRLLGELEGMVNEKPAEVLKSSSVHQRGMTIETQVIGSYYDHPTLKDGSYRTEKEKQAVRKERIAAILDSGHWHVPRSTVHYYVPRESLIDQINAQFASSDEEEEGTSEDTLPTRTVLLTALHGLGGVGKTQLTIDYVKRRQASDKKVGRRCFYAWFDAEHMETEYRQFALAIGLLFPEEKPSSDVICERMVDWFSKQSDWFVVYDNAGDLNALKRYLPTGSGEILVTSRDATSWDEMGAVVELDVMDLDEAVALLAQVMRYKDPDSSALAKELGCLPLALAQAGRFIYMARKKKEYSVRDYLKKYDVIQAELLSTNKLSDDDLKRDEDGQPKPHATVMTIWQASLQAILRNKDYGEMAQEILHFGSFLATTPISDDLLLRCLGYKMDDRIEHRLSEAKDLLMRYSLISVRQLGTISVHQLVQEVVRMGIDHTDQTLYFDHLNGGIL